MIVGAIVTLAFTLACGSSATKPAAIAAGATATVTASATPAPPTPSPEPTSFTLTGTINAPQCAAGYQIENAAVTVKNETGAIIGATTTGVHEDFSSTKFGCTTDFSLSVPKAAFYQVQIGTHGGPAYSFADMQANGWKLALTLGQ